MQIVYSDAELNHYMRFAVEASPERPVLVDKFLEDATEVDVDCIADVGHFADPAQGTIVIGGFLEHIEFAGVHSGDAAMVLPPHTLSKKVIETMRQYTHAMARELRVIGLMNVQYAVKGRDGLTCWKSIRAPRAPCPLSAKPSACRWPSWPPRSWPARNWPTSDLPKRFGPVTGRSRNPSFPSTASTARTFCFRPEMRSTGEVMGLDADLGIAYAKSQMAANAPLPLAGRVFISVSDADKKQVAAMAQLFADLAFEIVSTAGTAKVLEEAGLKVSRVFKLAEGRPNTLDLLKNREIQLVINTPAGQTPRADEIKIRTTAVYTGTPIMTTLSGARAAARGIAALKKNGYGVKTIQEYH